jgi:hypothetical protein
VPAGLQLQNGLSGYQAINQCGAMGRYQFMGTTLANIGYAVKDATSQKLHGRFGQLRDSPNYWNYGLTVNKFLNSPEIQEQAIYTLTNSNYKTLKANNLVTSNTPPEVLGGYLAVCHLIGATYYYTINGIKYPGGLTWIKTGQGGDINNGTRGSKYYEAMSSTIKRYIDNKAK